MIIGLVIGFILGMALRQYVPFKISEGESESNSASKGFSTSEVNQISDENEKLLRRTKDMQQEIDELTNKNSKLMHELKEKTEGSEDIVDELDTAKKKIVRLESRILQLETECKEWKSACNELKNQNE